MRRIKRSVGTYLATANLCTATTLAVWGEYKQSAQISSAVKFMQIMLGKNWLPVGFEP